MKSVAGNDDWDDSVLTKEQVEIRMQRKVEAIIKRERSMAYAYSHQVMLYSLALMNLYMLLLKIG